MARSLAVLDQWRQCLVDKKRVRLVDVEAEKAEAAGRAAADTVQKLQRLSDDVVVGFVTLIAQETLQRHRTSHSIVRHISHLVLVNYSND